MIYCFPQHVSCFILLLACSQFRFMFFHACLHVFFLVLIYMLYALCHALDAQIFSFPCVDVWVYMLTCLILCLQPCLAQIYMFVCMSYAPMPMSMPSHACMLGFVFFHAFMLTPTCLDVLLHAYMHISMLICVDWCIYMLRSMFSICFMPSSMCLRASRLVYVLRPRPCLLCHVLLQPFCSFLLHFLVFWHNGENLIQTLWSLSLSIYQGYVWYTEWELRQEL